jgi:methionyl-tRNA formyltransferase
VSRQAPPVRTIFFGSGAFAVPVLERLIASPSVRLVVVISAPPRAAGRHGRPRPTPVAEAAEALGLPVITPARLRDEGSREAVAVLAPRLIVLADYGRLIPGSILELPAHGALNLHPSLLPRHRGASPIAAAILAADRETGVTLMRMDAGLDTGPIIAQRRLPLRGDETAPELEAELARLAGDLLAETLDDWLAGTIRARPQPVAGVTLTRPLRREDGRLDPARPAVVLERQVRAYQPWPGSYLEADEGRGRLIVWRAEVAAGEAPPGTLLAWRDGLALATGQGLLVLHEVQPAGGRRMSGAELRRGRPGLVAALPLPADAAARASPAASEAASPTAPWSTGAETTRTGSREPG